jgi:hypothetical protein
MAATHKANPTVTFTPSRIVEGGKVFIEIPNLTQGEIYRLELTIAGAHYKYIDGEYSPDTNNTVSLELDTRGFVASNQYAIKIQEKNEKNSVTIEGNLAVAPRSYANISGDISLHRANSYPSRDQALWVAIRQHTQRLGFEQYNDYINAIFNPSNEPDSLSETFTASGPISNIYTELQANPLLNLQGPYAYSVLKLATQAFLATRCGVVDKAFDPNTLDMDEERYRLDDPYATPDDLAKRLQRYLAPTSYGGDAQALPYLNRIAKTLIDMDQVRKPAVGSEGPFGYRRILEYRLTRPSLIELIWNYWHEEGMVAQTMAAITLRFQNQRSSYNDPLGELEIDPLRPLNNLLWGYIQDQHNHLTVNRRALEYAHQYGLNLIGKAVRNVSPADNRSKFIEAFHNLMHRAAQFYREDADTTVMADAFPLLNALKDVHLILAEGAHNQFGDLAWTSRSEMLSQQWLLARPEMREFLRGRHMVPYQEKWMGAVDSMKKLQGWSDTTISHFNQLAVDGERVLLSVRYGDWSELDNTEEQAKNWVRYWKPELQRYLHGYRVVTGVDLSAEVTDTQEAQRRYLQPSILLQHRLEGQTPPRALGGARQRPALGLQRVRPTLGPLAGGGQLQALEFEDGQ